MSCVSLWADEISHTQHTPHALSGMYQCALQRALHGNQKSRLRQCPRNTSGGNNLQNSYICTVEPTRVVFIAVAVLSCDLALMKFFPRAWLGLPSIKL